MTSPLLSNKKSYFNIRHFISVAEPNLFINGFGFDFYYIYPEFGSGFGIYVQRVL